MPPACAKRAPRLAKRDGLDDRSTPYVRNALQRCERLPDEVSRMQGQGATSGSVAGGGIYRELMTRELIPPSTVVSPP